MSKLLSAECVSVRCSGDSSLLTQQPLESSPHARPGLREVSGVRRPGNIIVITDTDWSLWPSHPLLLIAGIMTISNNLFLVTRGHARARSGGYP